MRAWKLFWGLLLLACPLAGPAPLEARPTPRLLLTADDFARIERMAKALPWASAARAGIVQAAESWPAAHNARYGLAQWQLPPEGGQWTLWYICPTHGVSLQFRGPGQNICPVDGQNYTGWPYDQVIYARRHSESAAAARDNGLAYRLTGNAAFAREAARILLAYASVYSTYPIKDVNNRLNATSGARVTAQTLDEAIWLIPMVWAYDLIADSGALDAAVRARIEQDLLRAAAAVIARNDARQSNWQSWHNAAIGAVGFALEDPALAARAVEGASGFRFQMRESVLGDGFWYEAAWGYHFFALEPLSLLAEMAARAGADLYAEPRLRLMFEAPLRFALPDWTLPPFNDSGNTNILTFDRLYEIAYARYGDPLYAAVLGRRARGREALYWGVEALPQTRAPSPASAVFSESGNAVLRAGPFDNSSTEHYLALKFGPHGGWHGHYDKLNFISFARGGIMAVDPGTQSYAAKTHDTWDKVTVAHNTVVVNQTTQAEATGRLLAFAALPAVSAVRADAGPAYKQAALERTVFLTPEYALDSFGARSTDGAEHRFDWVYHNYGTAATPLPLAPYSEFPSSNGYQHLTENRAALTADAWQVSFDMNESLLSSYGATFTNVTGIRATFQYSREQAASGLFAGKMGYDFSEAQGYILFSTPTLSGQPPEVPARLAVMIYGDGSGHRLALRLYDATDERFVYTVGPVNWTGWRLVTASDPAGWTHYLGNNDGVFDTPTKSVALELTYVSGRPAQGALYVDDIALEYPSAGRVPVADFERLLRGLRLWMLGAPETTVVVGNGLGPDLRKPVPFAMARRSGTEARFLSLLEPYGEAPRVTAFRALSADSFRVTAAEFDDRISLDGAGALRFARRSAGALRRLGLSGATALEDDGRLLLRLASPVPVQADFSADGKTVALQVSGALPGELRLLAPAAEQMTLNGATIAFRREGDYRVVSAGGAPAWGAAVNAASFAPGLAPGALFSIFGTNLALGTASAAALPLPGELAGASVTINGARVPLLYVSPQQINAQLPFNLPAGAAQVAVTTPAGATASQTLTLAPAAPGIFAALPGETVVIYATGLGPVTPPVPAGSAAGASPLSLCALPVAVTIAGTNAMVTYAGLAPGWAGLYQVNAQLPPDLPPGAHPVVITVNSTASNSVNLR